MCMCMCVCVYKVIMAVHDAYMFMYVCMYICIKSLWVFPVHDGYVCAYMYVHMCMCVCVYAHVAKVIMGVPCA